MKLTQGFRMAIKSVLSSKLRTALSMLGILIGVATVIALVGMGQGSTKQVEEQVASLGTNSLSVTITGRGTATSLSLDDAMALADIPNVEGVSPTVSGSATVKYGKNSTSVTVEGITPDYEQVSDFSVQSGRYIASMDVKNTQKVALIGVDTATELFEEEDPVGKTIQVNGSRFTIVGLLEAKGSSLTGSNDEKIAIPITTGQKLFDSVGVRTVALKVTDLDLMDITVAALEAKLLEKFRGDDSSYRVFNQQDAVETLNSVNETMNTMLLYVAAITLLVGGIGVMNIMLVSVTERTREIGIRKSLGAKRRDILFQFLVEAVVISGMGGALGIGFGYLGSYVIGVVNGTDTSVPFNTVILSFAFSAFVGIVFGIFPANKASRLKPVDALRHD
ncbi:putative ABC transport system permease protein [Paenibacillus algorifonticola]|uniref:Putative ABC transport system permease protein n=1 Tax=Paenibacillus algorifonticola TaxID=684063 RepID=A0A1I2IDN9_9BACL|nr:ABC transporter permease [Paenibacillus algorifonticola]SFF38956.1 putative ABC transport system permease protein [Paenibacillus algorifonticola]